MMDVNTAKKNLQEFCTLHGIVHQTSYAHIPQQNDVAECKNRYILDIVRSPLFDMHVLKTFLGDAILASFFL